MNVSEIIAAQTSRISQLHAVCAKQAATIQTLQRQLAAALATGGGKQWTAEDVVKTFAVYDPATIEALTKALNARGASDPNLAAVITNAINALDRSDAAEMLNTLEHEVYSTPAPPPAPGSLTKRMLESTAHHEPAPAFDSAEDRLETRRDETPPPPAEPVPMGHDGPAEITPEGLAIDDESKKPIKPLTAADLPAVPRKKVGGMADEKIEAAL